MKKSVITRIVSLILASVVLVNGAFCEVHAGETSGERAINSTELSSEDKRMSSLFMLNYMTVLSQEINASSNSKLYLATLYSSIVNNINPNVVDEDSLEQIEMLLNTINAYQSIETKRERIQYIYEQNQANAIKKAVPNPVSVLSAVQASNPIAAVAAVLFLAVDAKESYSSYVSEADNKYLEESWELDDSAANNLHESRRETFDYMVRMCNKNNLDGKLALTESTVQAFVEAEGMSNVTRRIEKLESNQETYQAYGKYWLVLAESYYNKGEYEKCLRAISTYENMHINIFREDSDFAKALSLGIAAAREVYEDSKYRKTAEHFAELITENTTDNDWPLKYVVAQTYVDLAGHVSGPTQKEYYLRKAYDLTKQNINHLVDQQLDKNQTYLADIVKVKADKKASKEKKKEIDEYNDWIEEERKVELPPVYQPLVLNCDLLFAIANELKLDKSEKADIEDTLHGNGQVLFLVKQLEDIYWFEKDNESAPLDINFDGKKFEIPASYLTNGTTICVTVNEGGKETVYEDWSLKKVDRGKSKDVNEFVAVYTSKSIKEQKYSDGSTVKLEIIPAEGSSYDALEFTYNALKGKKFKVLDEYTFELAG